MSLGAAQMLQKSLEEAQKNLNETDNTIRKLTGRDPFQLSSRPGPRGRRLSGGATGGRMRAWTDEYLPPAKRRDLAGTAVGGRSRLGRRLGSWREGDEETIGRLRQHPQDSDGEENQDLDVNTGKPTLQSSVTAAPIQPRPAADPSEDKKSKSRNRRMFGILMGTLQKFKEESAKNTKKEQRRLEIEEKLEEAAAREKEEAVQARRELFQQRRSRRQEVVRLAQRMSQVEMFEEWNAHSRLTLAYIKTRSKPPVFYLPTQHNESTWRCLAQSQTETEERIRLREAESEEIAAEGVQSREKPVTDGVGDAEEEQTPEESKIVEDSAVGTETRGWEGGGEGLGGEGGDSEMYSLED